MSHAALQYAEQKLGVHKVYEDAQEALAGLDDMLASLDVALDNRRASDDDIMAREMDLTIQERGKHPDHSEAALARHIKEVHHKDETLRDLRYKRRNQHATVSGLELDIEHRKYKIKVLVARMEQLGGYFNFLAAVKNAEPQPVQYAEASTSSTTATGGETEKTGEQQ